MKNRFKTGALLMTIFTMLVSPLALAETPFEAGSSGAKSLEADKADLYKQPIAETPPTRYRDEIDAVDYTWMSLSSLGLGVAGAALGSFALIEANSGCKRKFLGCMGSSLLGGTVGFAIGVPLATFLYGEAVGFDGSYMSTFGGAVLGGLTSGLLVAAVAALDDDRGSACCLSAATLIAGPIVGSIIGYTLSVDTRPSNQPRSASLLDFNPADGLRLSVPAIGFTRENQDSRFQISLLSGTF